MRNTLQSLNDLISNRTPDADPNQPAGKDYTDA
jgi:hypothetical protein